MGDALHLAMQNKSHVDTVLAYREQHLKELDHEENHPEFKQAAEQLGPVDWTQIKAKIEMKRRTNAARRDLHKDLSLLSYRYTIFSRVLVVSGAAGRDRTDRGWLNLLNRGSLRPGAAQ